MHLAFHHEHQTMCWLFWYHSHVCNVCNNACKDHPIIINCNWGWPFSHAFLSKQDVPTDHANHRRWNAKWFSLENMPFSDKFEGCNFIQFLSSLCIPYRHAKWRESYSTMFGCDTIRIHNDKSLRIMIKSSWFTPGKICWPGRLTKTILQSLSIILQTLLNAARFRWQYSYLKYPDAKKPLLFFS